MAARGAVQPPPSPGGHNTLVMSPAATLDRNNVVKFDTARSFEIPRSPMVEKLDSRESGLHRRPSLETRSEREVQDLPRNNREGLFTRLLSYKWKGDAKDDGKNLC